MKNLWYCLLVLGLVLSLVLSGCKAPEKPAPPPVPPPAAPPPGKPAPPKPEPTREEKLIEGAKKEGKVEVWAYSFPGKEGTLKPFTEKYPFIEVTVWDAARGEAAVARAAEEAKAGIHNVDVFLLGGEIPIAVEMGLIEEYEFPRAGLLPDQPAHNYWRRMDCSCQGIPYNTKLVPPERVPRTWEDLKDPWWRGKAIASTSANRTPMQWAYLWGDGKALNWERSVSFWREVIGNAKPQVGSGYTGNIELLAAGEAAIMLSGPLNTTMRARMKGAPVALAPLPLIPGTSSKLALAKGAPHPNAARLFLDMYTSEEGIVARCNAADRPTDVPEFADKVRINQELKKMGLEVPRPMPDEIFTAENVKRSEDLWFEILGVTKGR